MAAEEEGSESATSSKDIEQQIKYSGEARDSQDFWMTKCEQILGKTIFSKEAQDRQQMQQPVIDEHNQAGELMAPPVASASNANLALPMTQQAEQQQQQPHQQQPWPFLTVAHTTTQGMRLRMMQANDQLGQSLRQFYASASTITDVPPSYHNIPGIVPYYHGRNSGPPPSYDDVINPYAPPPSYQSLFGQMREARKTSRGLLDLLRRLLIILASTLGCTLLVAFMILIPFTMIIVGAVYIDECRVEHIPAFLLVGGLVWASKNIIHCYGQCQPVRNERPLADDLTHRRSSTSSLSGGQASDAGESGGGQRERQVELVGQINQRYSSVGAADDRRLKSSICESLLNCVLFGWFIAGCVIVFRNYEPDFDNSNSARYCHRTVYMYTFWLVTSALLVFGLFVSCICCLMVSSAIASHQEDELA